MQNWRAISLGVLVLTVATVALAAQSTYSLKRAAKEGDVLKYSLKSELKFDDYGVSMTGIVTEKVTKVQKDGTYTIESKVSDMKALNDGQEVKQPDEIQTITLKATGEPTTPESPAVGGTRALTALIVPAKPVRIGDSWEADFKGDEASGNPPAKGTYKAEAKEKIGEFECVRVKYSIKQRPNKEANQEAAGTSNCTAWIDIKDGSIVKMEGSFKSEAEDEGEKFTMSGKVSLMRIAG